MTTFEDPRLEPIRRKVDAGERLGFDDGITLYRTPDLLGVGWMANRVRERLHGNKTFFNVNRHINPTDVCVASCKLCAFGKKAKEALPTLLEIQKEFNALKDEEKQKIGGLIQAVNGAIRAIEGKQ